MFSIFHWFDQQTGLLTALAGRIHRPVTGGPAWRFVWPVTILFTFLVEAITGLVVWMFYSPGAQSSWESIYYLQYHVLGGWLLRAIHFYAGQAMLVLAVLYLVQMVLTGACRPARAVLFWTVLLMALVTVGLNLTGDLLAWDQNSYWAGNIRIAYLRHSPVIGPWLAKLAVGGPQFGTFTLTRFLALHIGVFTMAILALILLHAHLAARKEAQASASKGDSPIFAAKIGAVPGDAVPYWPRQAGRDAVACIVVLAVIVALSLRNGTAVSHAGIELGSPANPIDDPGTARPEWSFRCIYQLHEMLVAWPEIVPIMIIPGITVLLFFAMPLVGRNMAGRILNVMILLGVLGTWTVLTWLSYANDKKDPQYQAAVEAGHAQAERVKELAVEPTADEIERAKRAGEAPPRTPRIPTSGALSLLAGDPKTQGPQLFNRYCASCHDYSTAPGVNRPEKPAAADLAGFASRAWLTDFLTVKGITSPRYFGNTKFKQKDMYGFIKDTFQGDDVKPEDRERIIIALSHEAELKSQTEADAAAKDQIAAGTKLIGDTCSDCHTFHGKGTASGPDLTGYGSRAWLMGIISDPAHKRFYGKENDRMPAFAESVTEPGKNVLSQRELELLVSWLRGEWYEAKN